MRQNFTIYKASRIVLSVLFTVALFGGPVQLIAGETKYADSWGEPGYTVETQDGSKVIINYSIKEFSLSTMEVKGEAMQNIELPGQFLPNNAGAPNLPGSGRYIAIPQGAEVTYNIVAYRSETFTNVNVAPAFRIPWANEDGDLEYIKDESIYSANKFYPEQPILLSEKSQVRGIDVVLLGITPFHYNPVTRQLIVYRDIKIEVTFNGGNGHFGDNRLRSRWWDPLLSDMLLNFESLPKMDYNKAFQSTDETGCEYLIISPTGPEFLQWADSIRMFRTLQGIKTEVVTLAEIGGNNASVIENYINNAYNTWDIPPAAILLLGDYGTNAANSVVAPIYDSYCVSDNIYADVNADQMPDIIAARLTVNNATQLQTMVTKFINYERNPPTDPDFYAHPMTCLGYQTERWFQICTESVAGFWEQELGKTTNRVNAIYNGNPQTGPWSTATNTATVLGVFGPNGLGYIPATPGQVNCTWNGTGNTVVNGINNGAFMLLHRDHGDVTLWGEPDFSNSHVNNLTNTDLSYIWSVNCLTGKYNNTGEECLVEKLHRHTSGGNNSGALGAIGDSEISYSFVNDVFVWGAFDNMWPEFMPQYGTTPTYRGILPGFANAAGKYFLQQSSWPYNTDNKEVTYNLFHHHGDAFLSVYSEVPQNLTVSHNPILYAGVTSFEVSADVDALIALTVNGEIIGTATATGSTVAISIPGQVPPDQMLVTITKQNYYRYESFVEVIPPTGPYVVKDSYLINDVAGGNGDGLMDYGETNLLTLTVKNVGVQQADNVVVTINSADSYMTITDNMEAYGNIAAGATSVVTDGFSYSVANNIPDGHMASIEVTATSGTEVWVSYISIQGHAPVLEYINYTLADPAGNNNGKFDPGETVEITLNIDNTGSSQAQAILGELTENDVYLTINTPQMSFGNLEGGASGNAVFSITAAPNTPAGHLANLSLELNGALGITGSGELEVVIGQIPVLIIDLDGNGNSAIDMEASLGSMDISYEKLSSFPPDLSIYTTIFVCLGIYSENHQLTSSEGQALADYLNNGGSVYMEGGDTWYYDPETPVHAMFKINGTNDGSSDMGNVLGKAGTFTEGMTFTYNGDNSWMDRIEPIAPAVKIFDNQTPLYGTGVAHDAGSYKTIGTSHEFGGLQDGTSPSTQEELMTAYLDFLGLTLSLQAIFSSNTTQVCESGSLNFYDQSFGNVISWEWIFEGGNPATSSEQNPTVQYTAAGNYDVTLTVSDGEESNSLTLENYVTVSTLPAAPSSPTGLTTVCAGWGNTTYSITSLPGVTLYDWILEPSAAGTVIGSGSNITIQWTSGFLGSANLKVAGENVCGTGPYSSPITITRYMPEVTLEPFEWVCVGWPAFELTGGIPSGGSYSGPGVSGGWFNPTAAGAGTHTITYTYEDVNGCQNTATGTILVDPCTGQVENEIQSGLVIFPNPGKGVFTLLVGSDFTDEINLKVYSSLNEIVYEKEQVSIKDGGSIEIDLSHCAKGIYYLHLSDDTFNEVKKIIIQK